MNFKLFNFNNPVKNSIIIYLIFIIIYLAFFKNTLENEKKNKYILPIIVISLSILIYYFFIILKIKYT